MEAVNEVALALPLMFREPVTVWKSVIKLPIFTPVSVTWNSIPLPVTTVSEPDIVVLPLRRVLPLTSKRKPASVCVPAFCIRKFPVENIVAN